MTERNIYLKKKKKNVQQYKQHPLAVGPTRITRFIPNTCTFSGVIIDFEGGQWRTVTYVFVYDFSKSVPHSLSHVKQIYPYPPVNRWERRSRYTRYMVTQLPVCVPTAAIHFGP